MSISAAELRDEQAFRELYNEAFPPNERKPWPLLVEQRRRGVSDMLELSRGGEPVGLAVVLHRRGLALLDFFAIGEKHRGMGLGSEAISCLASRYAQSRLFLEIEKPKPDAPNALQRESRRRFYLRNGLRSTGVFADIYGDTMELLTFGEDVSFEEYSALLRETCGAEYFAQLNPRPSEQ